MGVAKEFKQTYYTSSKTGLSGTADFQTKAASAAIGPERLRLIEQFVGGYRLPPDRDRASEDGQPIALKSFSLGDLWCVSVTQYRKFDWTGTRTGSFFAHNLVCSREEFLQCDANPFALFHSGCFIKEDTGTGTELPLLRVEVPGGPLAAPRALLRAKYADRLRSLIDAILSAVRADRPVVLVADPGEAFELLEGLITILPLSIRAEVSFSTYQFGWPPVRVDDSPVAGGTKSMVCTGTTQLKRAGKSYSDIEFEHSYQIFDFEENRFPKPSSATRFAEWMAGRVLAQDDEVVESCTRFLSKYGLTPKNLDEGLLLFSLPELVRSQERRSAETALRFADTESRNLVQADASLDILLNVPAGSAYEFEVTMAALAIAARHSSERLGQVYQSFLRLLKAGISRRDQRQVTTLLGVLDRLPVKSRAALLSDLADTEVSPEHMVQVLSALGTSALSEDQIRLVFENLLRLLETALNHGDGSLLEKVTKLSERLPAEEQCLLPCRVKSAQGIKDQVLLLEAVLARQAQEVRPDLAAALAALGERAGVLFETAVRNGQPQAAGELLTRVAPRLPAQERSRFLTSSLDHKLEMLWQALRGPTGDREWGELGRKWLVLFLEDELLATIPLSVTLCRELGSQGPGEELRRELAARGFEVSGKIEGRRSAPEARLTWRDSRNTDYAARQTGNDLQIWRRDNEQYARRLARLLEGYLTSPPGTGARPVIWGVVLGELEAQRVGPISPQLFERLCQITSLQTAEGQDSIRLYRAWLIPMFAGAVDKRPYVQAVLSGLFGDHGQQSREEAGNLYDVLEMLRKLDVYPDDLRRLYPGRKPRTLFDVYWSLLGGDRDGSRVEAELSTLYEASHHELFDRLARKAIDGQRAGRGGLVCRLFARYPGLAEDRVSASRLLSACRQVPDELWPKVVSDVYNEMVARGMDKGVACLAQQCILRMRELMRSGGGRISQAENGAIDGWFNSGTAEESDIDPVVVFREALDLRLKGTDLKPVLETALRDFESRKARLAREDYVAAARQVLGVFAGCDVLATPGNWKCVEQVATPGPSTPRGEDFRTLLEMFLRDCSRRRDYPDIVGLVTLRWIGKWADYRDHRDVLRVGYSQMDSRNSKERYRETVLKGLSSIQSTHDAEAGVQWWQRMIDQPEEKGFFSRLLGR